MIPAWQPVLTCARHYLNVHLRGAILPLAAAAFITASFAIPESGAPNSLLRLRSATSLHLGVAGLVLWVLALTVPLSSVRGRRRGFAGGGPGKLGGQGASLFGHGVFLLTAGCLLGAMTYGLLSIRLGTLDGKGAKAFMSETLITTPERLSILRNQEDALRFEVPADRLSGNPPRFGLRLAPVLKWDPNAPAVNESSLMKSPLLIRWHRKGVARWQSQRISITRGRAHLQRIYPETQLVSKTKQQRKTNSDQRPIIVEIRRRGGHHVVEFPADSVTVTGGRASVFASLAKSCFLLGLASISLMAFCLWLSGFVSYPLAVAGALTFALAGAFRSPELDWSWAIPGAPLVDPATRVQLGANISWSDLIPTALQASFWCVVVCLLPFRDWRLEGSDS